MTKLFPDNFQLGHLANHQAILDKLVNFIILKGIYYHIMTFLRVLRAFVVNIF